MKYSLGMKSDVPIVVVYGFHDLIIVSFQAFSSLVDIRMIFKKINSVIILKLNHTILFDGKVFIL